MPESVINMLIQLPIVALLAWYIVRRDVRFDSVTDATREELRLMRAELKETQDKRVADMKEIAEKLISVAEKTNDALGDLAGAIREQKVLLERAFSTRP